MKPITAQELAGQIREYEGRVGRGSCDPSIQRRMTIGRNVKEKQNKRR
jgi:hypothetical protein